MFEQSTAIIRQLDRNAPVLFGMFSSVPPEHRTWRSAPEKWCALEILCHLYDEEREDFRARTKHVLETPGEPMPGIDPVALVTERKYIEQNYDTMLASFLQERKNSIAWLNSLENPNWDSTYQHPKVGPLKARMFLTNWLEHDYLHMRQLLTLKHNLLKETTGESLKYAGDW
ncbi:MAG TPA: DinB family protein [Bacteroidia bacterium]|nr:DinB family protein [Bacteroidia bacterium]